MGTWLSRKDALDPFLGQLKQKIVVNHRRCSVRNQITLKKFYKLYLKTVTYG